MSQHDDFIARLERYLDDHEGSTPMPDRIRQSVRASLPETKQTSGPSWVPRRFETMSLHLPVPAQIGLAAAAVVAAVVVGATVIGGVGRGFGGPTEPSADPTPSPSAAEPSGPQSLYGVPGTGNIPAGSWFLDVPAYPARIEFEVPEGWWHFWSTETRDGSDVHAILVDSSDTGAANGSAWGVAFAVPDQVSVDPCDPDAGTMDPSATESADAMAAAFQTWTDFPVTSVDQVTIGGYSGTRVELATDGSPCLARLFTTPLGYAFEIQRQRSDYPPQPPEQFTFLDVEGSVLVLWTTDYPQTNFYEMDGGAEFDPEGHAEDQLALRGILESIELVPRP